MINDRLCGISWNCSAHTCTRPSGISGPPGILRRRNGWRLTMSDGVHTCLASHALSKVSLRLLPVFIHMRRCLRSRWRQIIGPLVINSVVGVKIADIEAPPCSMKPCEAVAPHVVWDSTTVS